MSKINVNTWEPEGAGTAATLMATGDTVTVPSGATLAIASGATLSNSGTATGFSSIAWQAVQTTGFTAVAGKGYPCNTTAGAFTVTLPASASVGDQIAIVDYAGTFDTDTLTLGLNGLKMKGATENNVLTTERQSMLLTYVDATQGWVATSAANSPTPALNLVGYSIDFLVVAGGGGPSFGGGGGGGMRTSTQTCDVSKVITATVGDGGAYKTKGTDSSIAGSGLTTITSTGGGYGGGVAGNTGVGGPGGSGGGGGHGNGGTDAGGAGNTPSTSPVQGYAGGTGRVAPNFGGGGGGGASAIGATAVGTGTSSGGTGGAGAANSITGGSVTYAGGGGGAYGGAGGAGGGGNASTTTSGSGDQNGTANTGGGGGGANGATMSGGKGIVIISVPTARYSGTSSGAPTITTSGANTILSFTGTGTYTV